MVNVSPLLLLQACLFGIPTCHDSLSTLAPVSSYLIVYCRLSRSISLDLMGQSFNLPCIHYHCCSCDSCRLSYFTLLALFGGTRTKNQTGLKSALGSECLSL